MTNPLKRNGRSQEQRKLIALTPEYVKIEGRELSDWLVYLDGLSQEINYFENDAKTPQDTWQSFFRSNSLVQLAIIGKTPLPEKGDSEQEDIQNSRYQWNNIWEWHKNLNDLEQFKSLIEKIVFSHLNINNLDDVGNYFEIANNFKKHGTRIRIQIAYTKIIKSAEQFLNSLSTNEQINLGNIPPHFSLFLAFIELLKLAHEDLNKITERHLKFFYEDILKIARIEPTPDKAHLVFKLAKTQDTILLPANTRFKAGKDKTGKERIYQLDSESVINRAEIASLKGLLLDPNVKILKEIPVLSELQEKENNKIIENASLGLVIAADILLLKEGRRIIEFEFNLDKFITKKIKARYYLPDIFQIYFSGEKSWIQGKILFSSRLSEKSLRLVVELLPEMESVVHYKKILDGVKFDTDKPVARIVFNSQVKYGNPELYPILRQLKTNTIDIRVYVEGVKNLLITNENSIFEPNKPFKPLGLEPIAKSSFYIGSQEVFQKNLTVLFLDIVWDEFPENEDKEIFLNKYYRGYFSDDELGNNNYFNEFFLSLDVLQNGAWSKSELVESYKLFSGLNPRNIIQENKTIFGKTLDKIDSLNVNSKDGFLRLTLNQSFLHKDFFLKNSLQTLALSQNYSGGKYINGAVYEVVEKPIFSSQVNVSLVRWKNGDGRLERSPETTVTTVTPVILNQPFTPQIRTMSINYGALASRSELQLFHIYPFQGFKPIGKHQQSFSVLPKVIEEEEEKEIIAEKEILIGIKELQPPATLSVYFEIAEDTGDPQHSIVEEIKPDWYYLQDNDWINFEEANILNSTGSLTTSGIVEIIIPEKISKEKTTILDASFYWIKASINQDSQAMNKIIKIHTQAAQATFIDQDNDPGHLDAPLPAQAITRLEVPQIGIKTILQPLPSFGGKPPEKSEDYFTRVSEHLRHKGRAVTIFDYEHIILAKFPEIRNVRCLNHTKIDEKGNLNSFSPGCVTLITFPHLGNNPVNINLMPRTSELLLQKIKETLQSLCSDWVKIYTVHPCYEPIKVNCKIELREAYRSNPAYYRKEVAKEIVSILAPWTVQKNTDMVFRNRLSSLEIVKELKNLPYIQNIIELSMNPKDDEPTSDVLARQENTIFTSVPLEEHDIKQPI